MTCEVSDGPRTCGVIALERTDDHPARVSLDHHDYVLEHLARQTLRQARAEATRHRRSIEAQRAREETMSSTDERITGFVALVIQPDPSTILKAYDLAQTLMPAPAEQVTAPGSLPHLTLTQCALRDAPRERVREFVARLDDALRGAAIPLGAVVTFGAGFLFWCAEAVGPGRRALQAAHEYAVTLADRLLDPVANEAVVEATARAFADEPELVANARRYGYALIRERYLPHITLGFDPRLGGGRPAGSSMTSLSHTMTMDRIVLARLGRYGRVEATFSV